MSNLLNTGLLNKKYNAYEYDLTEIPFDKEKTTNTEIYTSYDISNYNTLFIKNNYFINGKEVKIKNINIIKTTINLTNEKDPFNDNSLISKYLLDNNTNDLLNNHNATVYGSITYDNSNFNKGAKFNGNGYIKIFNKSQAYNFMKTEHTFLFWFIGQQDGDVVSIGAGGGSTSENAKEQFVIRSNKLILRYGRTNSIYYNQVIIDGIENKWYQVAITQTSDTVKVFLNGNKVFENNGSFSVSNYDAYSTVLGCSTYRDGSSSYDGNPSDYFTGMIDQVEIYNRALNEDEINKLYNNTGIKNIYIADISSNNLNNTPTNVYIVNNKELKNYELNDVIQFDNLNFNKDNIYKFIKEKSSSINNDNSINLENFINENYDKLRYIFSGLELQELRNKSLNYLDFNNLKNQLELISNINSKSIENIYENDYLKNIIVPKNWIIEVIE